YWRMRMTIQQQMKQMYSAFNQRDIDAVLSFMTEDVNWPKASEGGRAIGKAEIRAYWTRQWQQFDPTVTPLSVTQNSEGQLTVKVHQLVRSLAGELLSDSEVWHVYSLADGLIQRMDIAGTEAETPSVAFAQS